MDPQQVLTIGRDGLLTLLMVCAPILLVVLGGDPTALAGCSSPTAYFSTQIGSASCRERV